MKQKFVRSFQTKEKYFCCRNCQFFANCFRSPTFPKCLDRGCLIGKRGGGMWDLSFFTKNYPPPTPVLFERQR